MSTREAEKIIEEINDHVRTNAHLWRANASVSSHPSKIFTRPWSFILRYPVKSGGAVLVKIARHKEMNLAQSAKDKSLFGNNERDFLMLSKVAHVFQSQNGNFCFVKPYEFMPRWNAFAMEELDVRTLKDDFLKTRMVLNRQKDWANFSTLLAQATQWLQIFHQQAGEIKIIPLAETKVKSRIEKNAKIVGYDAKNLLKEYEALAQYPTLIATLHGDFHCGNIIINKEGRVGALDADLMQGAIYLDIAKLFADLETRSIQMLLQGNFMREKESERVYKTILENYKSSEKIPFDEKLFQLFIKVAVLEKWAFDESDPTSGAKSLARKFTSSWQSIYFSQLLKTEKP